MAFRKHQLAASTKGLAENNTVENWRNDLVGTGVNSMKTPTN